MTSTKRFKSELEDLVLKGTFDDLIRESIAYPNLVRASVYENGVTKDLLQCLNCSTEWEFSYKGDSYYCEQPPCPKCGYQATHADSGRKGGLLYLKACKYLQRLYACDRSVIDGQDGIAFVVVENMAYAYDEKTSSIRHQYYISGFGFLSQTSKKYFYYGVPSAGCMENQMSYYDGVVFSQGCRDYLNAIFHLRDTDDEYKQAVFQLEQNLKNKKRSQHSVSAERSQKIMNEMPLVENIPGNPLTRGVLAYKVLVRDNMTRKMRCQVYCSACKKTAVIETDEGAVFFLEKGCPFCGKKGSFVGSVGQGYTCEEIRIELVKENMLVLRCMRCRNTITEECTIQTEEDEIKRVYIPIEANAKESAIVINKVNGVWKVSKSQRNTDEFYEYGCAVFSSGAQKALKYSGLKEYLQTDQPRCLNTREIISYISVWLKHNCIEKIAKLECFSLTEAMIKDRDSEAFDVEGKTIYEILRLPKPLVHYLLKAKIGDPTVYHLMQIQMLYMADPTVTNQELEWCDRAEVRAEELCDIMRFTGIRVKQACEYLERVRISQCIPPKATVTSWRDYLKMSREIGVDISDKTARYPSSLKREHDRVMFKYNLIKDELREKEFAQVCDQYRQRYSGADDLYEIVAPTCLEDLFEEGRRLNHCVGGYADRVIEGRSCIMFIRKREEPEVPYFTMEILERDNCVHQIQGLSSRLIDKNREPKLLPFLKKWAASKKLTLKAV